MSKENKDEKRIVGASYILEFARNVILLNSDYSNYLNSMVYLEEKHGQSGGEGMDDTEKNQTIELNHRVRASCTNLYISYKTLVKVLNEEEDKSIIDSYSSIKTRLIVKKEDIENFVVGLNTFLVQDIVKNLLESSQDIVSSIYGESSTKTE